MSKDMQTRQVSEKVLGVDCSTNNLAWCLLHNDVPVSYGKIEFEGNDIFDKIKDASIKVKSLKDLLDYDSVAFEGAVFVNSPKTATLLAYVYGASIGALMKNKSTKMITVVPVAWQAFIGNKPLTKMEKLSVNSMNPGKSESWLKNEQRNYRKRRTASWVKRQFGIEVSDYDVADAFGIAYYGSYKVNSNG
jgi:Holliday junction resolvasome RuvABC endonuclease subunit